MQNLYPFSSPSALAKPLRLNSTQLMRSGFFFFFFFLAIVDDVTRPDVLDALGKGETTLFLEHVCFSSCASNERLF